VTPSGPLRIDAEERLWTRLEKYVDNKQQQTNERIEHLEQRIDDRYEPFRTSLIWFIRIVLGAFVAALAQYVYQHGK